MFKESRWEAVNFCYQYIPVEQFLSRVLCSRDEKKEKKKKRKGKKGSQFRKITKTEAVVFDWANDRTLGSERFLSVFPLCNRGLVDETAATSLIPHSNQGSRFRALM